MRNSRCRRTARHALAALCVVPLLMVAIVPYSPGEEARWAHITVMMANYIGDVAFAFTGAVAAGTEGMDLLGCMVVGFVTALGGGTVRDVLLGRFPIWWLAAWDEFMLVLLVGAVTFFVWPPVSMRWNLTPSGEVLFWMDTVGLGVFAATGARTGALSLKLHLAGGACCGMFSATFGGLMRDVLINRPPRILYSTLEIYAIPPLLGGFACSALLQLDRTRVMEAVMLGIWVTVHARVIAVNSGIRLPTFPCATVHSRESRPRDVAAEKARDEDMQRQESATSTSGVAMGGAGGSVGLESLCRRS